MNRQSLKERLRTYMHKHHREWVAKGFLADLARNSDLKATGEHTGRRLRELHEAGELEVKLIKGHAFYRAASSETLVSDNEKRISFFDSYITR